jgi:hypothetical protein
MPQARELHLPWPAAVDPALDPHAASRYSSSPWSPCTCSRVPCVSKPWSFSPTHARPKAAGAVEPSTLLHFPRLSFCRLDAFDYSSFNVKVPRWWPRLSGCVLSWERSLGRGPALSARPGVGFSFGRARPCFLCLAIVIRSPHLDLCSRRQRNSKRM